MRACVGRMGAAGLAKVASQSRIILQTRALEETAELPIPDDRLRAQTGEL